MDSAEYPQLPEIAGRVLYDQLMSEFTSFRIGGPAGILAVADDIDDLLALLAWADAHSVPVFILGAGTNILVADKGIRGLVISLGRGFGEVRIRGTKLTAGASARISSIVRKAMGHQLIGLEGLTGVPGTVGGAVSMNAGTPVGSISDSLTGVKALDPHRRILEIPAFELGLRYRGSDVRERGLIILEARFELRPEESGDQERIVKALSQTRKISQPAGIGTAGSVFKNPTGDFAGRLLEEAGAKGMQVGGARVSGRHANWIENTGVATAADVRELVARLQTLVLDRFGVGLECEIEFVGEWD